MLLVSTSFRYTPDVDETRWLGSKELEAWVRFAAVLELLPGLLDGQLTRDEGLTHFDYFTLAMLSEAPERTLRITALAEQTNATLPRLSRVIGRMERGGYVQRTPYEQDRRVTNATLTAAGWEKVVHAAPGHVATVRTLVIDALTSAQVAELSTICARLLSTIDPSGRTFVTPGVSSTSAPGLGLNLTGKPRCS